MAKQQQPVAREKSRSKRGGQGESQSGTGNNGHEEAVARYEKELAGYLQQRIKPGLNSGAIPLLARSIAKDIAHREHPNGVAGEVADEEEPAAGADEEATAEGGDEPSSGGDDEAAAEGEDEERAEGDDEAAAEGEDEATAEGDGAPDFESEMHDLQAELGEDWILRFSVQGDDAWLTAEKDDGSQRVEAPTADVLIQAVELINEGGGRSG